jgi:hypothetical protein
MAVRTLVCSALLGLLLTAGSAMAQDISDQQVDPATTGLDGRVVLATRCPVPVGDDDGICPSPPLQTKVTVRTADASAEIAELNTDSSGAFVVQLEPGMYLVEVAQERVQVSVLPDVLTTVTIRVPSRSLQQSSREPS